MDLDLRLPTIVIAGYWNQRIFGLDWLASQLFEIAEGQTIEVSQIINHERSDLPISYIEGIGVACTPSRLELYVSQISSEALAKVSSTARRALDLLPHTPVHGIGANFRFVAREALPEVVERMETPEHFKRRFRVTGADYKTTIQYEDDVTLNFRRQFSEEQTKIALNFHHTVKKIADVRKILERDFYKYYVRTLELIQDLYGVEVTGTQRFEIETENEGAGHGQ